MTCSTVFRMKSYVSDTFKRFSLYNLILIVLWSNIAVLGTTSSKLSYISSTSTVVVNLMKMNIEVTYGEKLQLHRYHIHQSLCGKHEYYSPYRNLESMSKTLKRMP